MIRRICFFAGPGAGKSTLAARTFAELKVRGHDVEHIPEYIKTWAHEGRQPTSYDQLYVFAKQVKAEDVILRNVKTIVTDSPLLMNTAYSRLYGFKCTNDLVRICQQFDRDFPPLNLFIERTVDYVDKGRYQDYDQAIAFDRVLRGHMEEHLEDPVHMVRVEEFGKMISFIEKELDVPNT